MQEFKFTTRSDIMNTFLKNILFFGAFLIASESWAAFCSDVVQNNFKESFAAAKRLPFSENFGLLAFQTSTGHVYATGLLLNSDTVLTAAHVFMGQTSQALENGGFQRIRSDARSLFCCTIEDVTVQDHEASGQFTLFEESREYKQEKTEKFLKKNTWGELIKFEVFFHPSFSFTVLKDQEILLQITDETGVTVQQSFEEFIAKTLREEKNLDDVRRLKVLSEKIVTCGDGVAKMIGPDICILKLKKPVEGAKDISSHLYREDVSQFQTYPGLSVGLGFGVKQNNTVKVKALETGIGFFGTFPDTKRSTDTKDVNIYDAIFMHRCHAIFQPMSYDDSSKTLSAEFSTCFGTDSTFVSKGENKLEGVFIDGDSGGVWTVQDRIAAVISHSVSPGSCFLRVMSKKEEYHDIKPRLIKEIMKPWPFTNAAEPIFPYLDWITSMMKKDSSECGDPYKGEISDEACYAANAKEGSEVDPLSIDMTSPHFLFGTLDPRFRIVTTPAGATVIESFP